MMHTMRMLHAKVMPHGGLAHQFQALVRRPSMHEPASKKLARSPQHRQHTNAGVDGKTDRPHVLPSDLTESKQQEIVNAPTTCQQQLNVKGTHLSAPEPSNAWRKKSSRIAFLQVATARHETQDLAAAAPCSR